MKRATRAFAALSVVATMVLSLGAPAFAITKTTRAARQADGTGWRWKPIHIYIQRGDRVKWANPTSRFHNVEALDSGTNWNYSADLPPGTSVRRRFTNTGDFVFDCTVHAGMSGIVHVRA